MGKKKDFSGKSVDRRAEDRSIVDKYSSVEFSVSNIAFIFQFKIWETSSSGMSILVKEDSSILDHLKVGDVLDMKYYPENLSQDPIIIKTEIKHITKDVIERIRGHFLIGLSVSEKQNK